MDVFFAANERPTKHRTRRGVARSLWAFSEASKRGFGAFTQKNFIYKTVDCGGESIDGAMQTKEAQFGSLNNQGGAYIEYRLMVVQWLI